MREQRMVTFLLLGAGIGFLSGLSPGPVLTLVLTETLKGGWLRGAAVAAGPLLADGPIVVLAVSVMHQLPPMLEPAISLVGGIFLLYLAITAALNARRAAVPRAKPLSARGGLTTGLLARGLSPHPYLFWFLVGGPTLLQAQQLYPGGTAAGAFLAGYYLTIVGSNVGLALALHRWMALMSGRLYRVLLVLASLILAVYGVLLLGRAAQLAPVESAR
jgi:threonine/homoserine/homoserine lactone efflux protein